MDAFLTLEPYDMAFTQSDLLEIDQLLQTEPEPTDSNLPQQQQQVSQVDRYNPNTNIFLLDEDMGSERMSPPFPFLDGPESLAANSSSSSGNSLTVSPATVDFELPGDLSFAYDGMPALLLPDLTGSTPCGGWTGETAGWPALGGGSPGFENTPAFHHHHRSWDDDAQLQAWLDGLSPEDLAGAIDGHHNHGMGGIGSYPGVVGGTSSFPCEMAAAYSFTMASPVDLAGGVTPPGGSSSSGCPPPPPEPFNNITTTTTTTTSAFDTTQGASNPSPFTCTYCQATFTDKTKLKVHTNKHTKPFRCTAPGCDYATAEKKSLQRHLLARSKWDEDHRLAAQNQGVKNIRHCCPREGCTYSTIREDNLKRHIATCLT